MKRRKLLQAGGGALGAGLATVGLTTLISRKRKKPNFLLITADDMGITAGCYGDDTVSTPNIDALANAGVLFKRGYVTQASCSPSRSSIFSAMYPHQNGQLGLAHRGYTMHRGVPTLPILLKQHGYRTGVFGKVHVHPEQDLPFDWNIHRNQGLDTRNVKDCAAYTAQFLKDSQDTPWFLLASFSDPHKPFKTQVAGLPEKPIEDKDVKPFAIHGEIDSLEVRKEVAGYYNSLQRVDIGVGLLIDLLKQTGELKNTLIVFVGDHGPPVSRAKTTCYEFGVHVPFIIAGLDVKAGVSTEFVSTVDIMPTLLRAAEIDFDPPEGSRELQPLLQGKRISWRNFIYTEFNTHGPLDFAPQRAIRNQRYKLIHNLLPGSPKPGIDVDGSQIKEELNNPKWANSKAKLAFKPMKNAPEIELYDLISDPIEYNNLAGQPQVAEIENLLKTELLTWQNATKDPMLNPTYLNALKEYTDLFNRNYDKVRAAAIKAGEKPPYRRIDMTPFQKDWSNS